VKDDWRFALLARDAPGEHRWWWAALNGALAFGLLIASFGTEFHRLWEIQIGLAVTFAVLGGVSWLIGRPLLSYRGGGRPTSN
jgi:hypothetical protein